jgi:uncharacterized membrane protein
LYQAVHNTDPKPFVWLKSADEIIDTIARIALRTFWDRTPGRDGHGTVGGI